MRKFRNIYTLFALVVIVFLASCTREEATLDLPNPNVPSDDIAGFNLETPGVDTDVEIEATGDDIVITWEAVEVIANETVTYEWLLDTITGDFSNPLLMLASNSEGMENQLTITQATVDQFLEDSGLEPGDNISAKWTVRATVNGSTRMANTAFTINFSRKRQFPDNLYLVGGSTPIGWNPGSALPFTKLEEGKFEIFAPLDPTGGGFKFLEILDWAGDWEINNAEPTVLRQDGSDNITVASNGFYRIYVDFVSGDNPTFVVEEARWGLIGSATPNGWSDPDTDMTHEGGYIFSYTGSFTDGEFKFRMNDSWDINFGDNATADGIPDKNSPNNIPLSPGGIYRIELNLNPNGYTWSATPAPV